MSELICNECDNEGLVMPPYNGESYLEKVECICVPFRKRIEELEGTIIQLAVRIAKSNMDIKTPKAERDEASRECVWQRQGYGEWGEFDSWLTSCNEEYVIVDDWHETPSNYCPTCGGKTVAKEPDSE